MRNFNFERTHRLFLFNNNDMPGTHGRPLSAQRAAFGEGPELTAP